MRTKQELAEFVQLDRFGEFDYAVPQSYKGPVAYWIYDKKDKTFGRPLKVETALRMARATINRDIKKLDANIPRLNALLGEVNHNLLGFKMERNARKFIDSLTGYPDEMAICLNCGDSPSEILEPDYSYGKCECCGERTVFSGEDIIIRWS